MKSNKKIYRKYHHHDKWEENHAGMWSKISGEGREILLQKAIELTGNAEVYGSYMVRAVKEWPYSCEHNLSCDSMNRQAWIGHAACCIAIGCPEEITRVAWHHLTEEQQQDANKKADEAIELWERLYLQKESKDAKSKVGNQCSFSFIEAD